jgi:hypothetical protein
MLVSTAIIVTTSVATAAADIPRQTSRDATRVRAHLRPEITATTSGSPTLGGLTSAGWPIVLRIAANGKRLRGAAVGLDMRCTSGASFALEDAVGGLKIKANGSVDSKVALPQVDAGSGVTFTGGSRQFHARINRKRWTASGSWRLRFDVAMSNGQKDSCDSGNVKWGALL